MTTRWLFDPTKCRKNRTCCRFCTSAGCWRGVISVTYPALRESSRPSCFPMGIYIPAITSLGNRSLQWRISMEVRSISAITPAFCKPLNPPIKRRILPVTIAVLRVCAIFALRPCLAGKSYGMRLAVNRCGHITRSSFCLWQNRSLAHQRFFRQEMCRYSACCSIYAASQLRKGEIYHAEGPAEQRADSAFRESLR